MELKIKLNSILENTSNNEFSKESSIKRFLPEELKEKIENDTLTDDEIFQLEIFVRLFLEPDTSIVLGEVLSSLTGLEDLQPKSPAFLKNLFEYLIKSMSKEELQRLANIFIKLDRAKSIIHSKEIKE